jgi:prepilin-type N-terminal cleavage/methylation domain-containing protein
MVVSPEIFKSPRRARSAFSLIELIAVMAIIAILLGLLAPGISAMTSTAGRKGAVNILMNTFEQARVAALESGAKVYVVLWQREWPEQDCLMVARDPVDWNPNEAGKDLIPLTRWISLPKGVLLYKPKAGSSNVFGDTSYSDKLLAALPATGNARPTADTVGVITYAPTGVILTPSPASKNALRVIVAEGIRGAGNSVALLTKNKEQGLFDIIDFRRYTGRPTLDVSSL